MDSLPEKYDSYPIPVVVVTQGVALGIGLYTGLSQRIAGLYPSGRDDDRCENPAEHVKKHPVFPVKATSPDMGDVTIFPGALWKSRKGKGLSGASASSFRTSIRGI